MKRLLLFFILLLCGAAFGLQHMLSNSNTGRVGLGSGAGGGGGPTWLLQEDFEGTGYENSWSEAGTTTPDEDFSTSGLGLPGSQCLRINTTGTGNSTHTLAAGHQTMEVYFQIYITTLFTAEQTLVAFLDVSDVVVYEVRLRTAGTLRVRAGSTSPQANTTDAMSTATLYHCWGRFENNGSGASVGTVEFSTTGTRSGSGNKFISVTTGPSSTDARKLRFGPTSTVTASDVKIDHVKLDDATIGNSP